MAVLRKNSKHENEESVLLLKKCDKAFTLTPTIVTLFDGTLTDIDIQALLEVGLRIIRFKISHIAKSDKLALLSYLKAAIGLCTEKHDESAWPVAISVDLPNACILTGYLKEEIKRSKIYIRQETTVEVTSENIYWNKCDEKILFIDDPFTLPSIMPGTEISIGFGTIVMMCTEVVNENRIKCKVELGGFLGNAQFVCIRGVRHKRPPLAKLDRQLIEFVKENQLDIITIHSIRNPITVSKIRAFFQDCQFQPSILCSICEQQGLDNIDSIIEIADGIILAREFLAQAIINPNRLTAIQMYISAKCRQHNKPLYISGNILENTLKYGKITCSEINDVENVIMQGAGFLLRMYSSAANVVSTMEMLKELSHGVERISMKDDFWPMCLKSEPPINAAYATILACALAVRQTETEVVIVPTVTGRTAVDLARMTPYAVILAVTTIPAVARKLQLYRGIMPIIYNKSGIKDWYMDMNERIKCAVQFGLKKDLLKYDQIYMVLRKATTSSAFCDQISSWRVVSEQSKKHRVNCPEKSNNPIVREKDHPH